MNNSSNSQAQSQQQGGQPAPLQRALPSMYKPDQMMRLPAYFSDADKKKYENGLQNLWGQMQQNAENTPQHQEAKKKIQEFSATLNKKMLSYSQARAAAAQQSGQAAQTQGQAEGSGIRPQSQGQQDVKATTTATQPSRPQAQQPIPPHIAEHINSLPWILPPQIQKDTPEAQKWLGENKHRMGRALVQMEFAMTSTKRLETMMQIRATNGPALSTEEKEKAEADKEKLMRQHSEAKRFVDEFRKSQEQLSASMHGQQTGQQVNGQAGMNGGGQVAPTRPSLNPQQPNPAQQNTQTVTAAFEAARNMQGANRAGMPNGLGNTGMQQQHGAMSGNQQQASSSFPNMPQHGAMASIKQEGGGQQPHINTAIPNHVQQMNRPNQNNNSPQSANPQSANGVGPPRALTHQAALTQAARTYSSGQTTGTPNVMGHSHAHPNISRTGNTDNNINSNKMPIPKNLPERAQQPAQPVNMPGSRPTLSGGPSMTNQPMQQPALQARPSYEFGEDGDRVLSKKKLDELVRQVTGGGDGTGDGDLSLMPEVEESILQVADDFVDQVLRSACKLAKVRGSEVLEIRDIQLVLERNYNIRIPGYASDEVRTVRKFQPAQGWVAKMSAVQAAKVTNNNKSDI